MTSEPADGRLLYLANTRIGPSQSSTERKLQERLVGTRERETAPPAHTTTLHHPDDCKKSNKSADSTRTVLARARRHWLPPVVSLDSKADPHSVRPSLPLAFISAGPPMVIIKHMAHTCTRDRRGSAQKSKSTKCHVRGH